MWETQTLFRVSAKLAAEGIFNTLDRSLNPDIFLIGFASEHSKSDVRIFLEPPATPYSLEIFNKVKALANQLHKQANQKPEPHTYIFDEMRHKRLIRQRFFAKAIEITLNNYTANQPQRVCFCSLPAPINGYLVYVVLQFDLAAFDIHHRLTHTSLPGGYETATSLLDATISEFLRDCLKALKELETEPGSGLHIIDRDYNEILRAAGKRFMYTPANGLHGLFDACNSIASLRYEQAEGIGGMLVARQGHRNIHTILTLEAPVPLRDYRTVRKLLEITKQGISLLTDAVYIYGLGKLEGEYDPAREDLFSICFTTYYTWQVEHAKHVMMKVSFGLPTLPKEEINRSIFRVEAKHVFAEISDEDTEALWELTEQVMNQQKGTILVISEGAPAEAERLAKQSFKVKPFQMTTEMMEMVTNIDGAVLLSPSGECFAIGVILDGLASERGEPSRGSRFNSALRYAESNKSPCLAVVVSEDGIVNLISSGRQLTTAMSQSR